jgi:hypothetical protein
VFVGNDLVPRMYVVTSCFEDFIFIENSSLFFCYVFEIARRKTSRFGGFFIREAKLANPSTVRRGGHMLRPIVPWPHRIIGLLIYTHLKKLAMRTSSN